MFNILINWFGDRVVKGRDLNTPGPRVQLMTTCYLTAEGSMPELRYVTEEQHVRAKLTIGSDIYESHSLNKGRIEMSAGWSVFWSIVMYIKMLFSLWCKNISREIVIVAGLSSLIYPCWAVLWADLKLHAQHNCFSKQQDSRGFVSVKSLKCSGLHKLQLEPVACSSTACSWMWLFVLPLVNI